MVPFVPYKSTDKRLQRQTDKNESYKDKLKNKLQSPSKTFIYVRANTVRPYILIDANELGIYAAGKRTVTGDTSGSGGDGARGAQGNSAHYPHYATAGVICETTIRAANINSGGNVGNFTLTVPSDWKAYQHGDGINYHYWHVTPPLGCTPGIYKLNNVKTSGTDLPGTPSYHYIQVGTSNTNIVWDADTATP